jgi:hypothetical protein
MTVVAAKDGKSVTVRIPFKIRKRGGRKLVLTPDAAASGVPPRRPRVDNTMVKALARAFRWRKLMEAGVYATVAEIAAAERINNSYVSRVLRLTLLAPDVIERILNGRQGETMSLARLTAPFPVVWNSQRTWFAASTQSAARRGDPRS